MLEPSLDANDKRNESSEITLRITPTTIALALAAVFAATFALIWMRAFVQMSSHGFDVSDGGCDRGDADSVGVSRCGGQVVLCAIASRIEIGV